MTFRYNDTAARFLFSLPRLDLFSLDTFSPLTLSQSWSCVQALPFFPSLTVAWSQQTSFSIGIDTTLGNGVGLLILSFIQYGVQWGFFLPLP